MAALPRLSATGGRLADLKLSLIRWMFGLWTVGTLTILGTTLAILKL